MKEITKFIGNRIRELREEKKVTQKELGELLGYSPMGISHFENGIRDLKLTDVEKLSKHFGVEMSYFFPEENKRTALEPAPVLFRAGQGYNNHQVEKSIKDFENFLDNQQDGK